MSSIYEALHEGRREIRLLQFDDVPDNGGISLLLENHSLVEPGLSFQALSYTWVTDAEAQAKANSNEKIDVDSKLISVNGIDFAVASNLFAALPHIRHMICNSPDEPKFFWVDAISINQEDDKEKASQVGMMGDIYRAASKVIIWLGEEDGISLAVFGLLQRWTRLAIQNSVLSKICEAYLDPTNVSTHVADESFPLDRRMLWTTLWTGIVADDRESYVGSSTLLQLDTFLRRSYWKRMWIIQERVLAKRAILRCGTLTADARHLDLLVILLRTLMVQPNSDEPNSAAEVTNSRLQHGLSADERRLCNRLVDGSVDTVVQLRAGNIWGSAPWDRRSKLIRQILPDGLSETFDPKRLDLWSMIRLMRTYDCGDLRDKVYGLYGLFTEDEKKRFGVQVQYGDTSLAKLYTAVCAKHISVSKRLDTIAFGGSYRAPLLPPSTPKDEVNRTARRVEQEMISEIPSWVPDFTGMTSNLLGVDLKAYNADNGKPAEKSKVIEDTRELNVEGVWCGIIKSTGQFQQADTYNDLIGSWAKFMVEEPSAPFNCRSKALIDLISHNVLSANGNLEARIDPAGVADMQEDFANDVLSLPRNDSPNRIESLLTSFALRTVDTPTMSQQLGATTIRMYLTRLRLGAFRTPALQERLRAYSELFCQLCWTLYNNRRVLFIMEGDQTGFKPERNGAFLGFAPREVLPGDRICVIFGCSAPIVLRKIEECEEKYRVVGYVTVYGIMDGEMVREDVNGTAPEPCTICLAGVRDLEFGH